MVKALWLGEGGFVKLPKVSRLWMCTEHTRFRSLECSLFE